MYRVTLFISKEDSMGWEYFPLTIWSEWKVAYTHGIHPPKVYIHPWYCKWHLSMVFVHAWYVPTHSIHPHMEFTHGIVSGIRFMLRIHWNGGLKHNSVSMVYNNLQCFAAIFSKLHDFFGRRICRSYLKLLVKILQKKWPYLDSLGKNNQIQRTIGLIGVRMREISLI